MSASESSAALKTPLDPGLTCLVLLVRFFGLPADEAQLRHEFGGSDRPFGKTEILRAAKHLGLKAGSLKSSWERLSATPLPAIAPCGEGRFLLVAKADAERVLVHDPAQERPVLLTREEFEKIWSGELLLLTKRAGLSAEERKFDFTWFIPAIVKYRKLLGEVLLVSFFLQLFALLTPLFFQVIIDKVLVHKGVTTLHVLGIGMVALTLFEVVLTALRVYLFTHTSSRIDVGLGAQMFRHLLRLPLSYFETRRVGDTVARVRELENIRQFLTSSTVTVVIDLVFTLVFLAVMVWYSPLLSLLVAGSIPFYILLSVVVTPAQPLLVVVPDEDQLEVEAWVENKDIGSVDAGQTVEIKVDAFPFTRYGTIEGELVTLSRDAVQLEDVGYVFAARARMDKAQIEVENGKVVNLTPGMNVAVEIRTGERRLIEYFLSPVLKALKSSAKER